MTWLVVILASTKLIPAAIGLYYYKQLNPSLRAIAALMLLGLLNESILFLLARPGGNNLYMLHIFAVVEAALLLTFFHYELKDPKIKRLIPGVGLILALIAIVYALFGDNILKYPSEPRVLNAIVIITFCLYLFYEMAVTGDSTDPLKSGSYFVNGAIMLYFTATFITWMMMNYVLTDKTVVYALYGSHAYINAFCNLVFAYGLWVTSRSSLSLS